MATQPTYQAGSSGHSTGVTSQTITLPGNAGGGDLVIFAIFFSGDPGTVTDPANWWLADLVSQGTNLYGRVYIAYIGAGAPNPAVTWTTARNVTWVCGRVSGTWGPAAVAWNWHNNGSVSSITTPGGTIQDVAGLALDLVGHASTIQITPPAGVTERIDVVPAEGPNASLNTVDATIDGEFGGRAYGVGVTKNAIAFTVIAQANLPAQNVAPSLRGTAQTAAGSAATATVNTPAGVVDGDLLVATLDWPSDPTTVTPPAGWSLLRADTGQMYTRVYTKIASGEGASSVWSWVGSRRYTIAVTAWSRVDRNSPINAHAFASSTNANIVQPAVTPALADCVLLAWYANDYTTYADTSPGGAQTELWDVSNSTAHTEGAWQVFRDANQPTGTRTFVHASGNGNTHAYQLAIAPAVTQTITPTAGIPTAASVPAPKLSRRIAPASITTSGAVPSPGITQTGGTQSLTGVGAIATAASVPSPTLSPGPVTVSPAGIGQAPVVPEPGTSVGVVQVAPTAIPSVAAVPGVDVTTRTGITTDPVASAAQVGAPSLTPGPVALDAGSAATSAHTATPAVVAGPVAVTPSGVTSPSSIPDPVVATGAVSPSPGGIASIAVITAPAVAAGTVTVTPASVEAGAQVPVPDVAPGAAAVTPASIGGASTVTPPTLTTGPVFVGPASTGSSVVVATPTVEPGSVLLGVDATPGGEHVDTPTVSVGAATILAASITSDVAIAAPTIAAGPVAITSPGVGTAASVSTPNLTVGTISLSPASIPSDADVPAVTIVAAGAALQPATITGITSVPNPDVTPAPVFVSPPSITTKQSTPPVSVTANATVAPTSGASSENVVPPAVTTADVVVTPPGITTVGSVSSPVISTGSVVAPASVTASSSVAAATVTGHATVTPAGVASTATIGTASVETTWSIQPAPIAGVGAVGLPELFPVLVLRPDPIASISAIAAPVLTGRLRDLDLTVREPSLKWQTSKIHDTWQIGDIAPKWTTGRVLV